MKARVDPLAFGEAVVVATQPSARPQYSQAGLTLEALAAAKRLPLPLLRGEGWTEVRTRDGRVGVGIPWPTLPEGTHGLHVRLALDKGAQRWVWDLPRGLVLAGPWGAHHAQAAVARAQARGQVPTVAVCESEVDAMTAWGGGLFAVATGGAQGWHPEWTRSLAVFAQVFVVAEPDDAGLKFASVVARDLITAAQAGEEVFILPFPPHVKDANVLWLLVGADRAAFKARLSELLAQAIPAAKWLKDHAVTPQRSAFGGPPLGAPPGLVERVRAYLESQGRNPEPRGDGRFVARCPLPGHEDAHPSFTFGPQGFRCWSRCGRSGSLGQLARLLGLQPAWRDRRGRLHLPPITVDVFI